MKQAYIVAAIFAGLLLFGARAKTASAKALQNGVPITVAYKLPLSALPYLDRLHNAEIKHGLPSGLLVRLAYQESRFREDIISGETVSSAGALGIMQIVPRWHPDVDPLNVSDAIDYAGLYMRRLYDQFGQWDKALAAYNWGPGNVSRKWTGDYDDLPEETRNYVLQIGGDVGLFA